MRYVPGASRPRHSPPGPSVLGKVKGRALGLGEPTGSTPDAGSPDVRTRDHREPDSLTHRSHVSSRTMVAGRKAGVRPSGDRHRHGIRQAAGKRRRLPSASAPGNAAQDGDPAWHRDEHRAATGAPGGDAGAFRIHIARDARRRRWAKRCRRVEQALGEAAVQPGSAGDRTSEAPVKVERVRSG